MRDKEVQEIINSLFPKDQERWIKVKYIDQDKAIKILWMPMNDEAAKPYIERNGFQVTAIGVRDEYIPQIAALFDVKQQVVGCLFGNIPNHVLEFITNLFDSKMEQLRKESIRTDIPDPV